MCRAGRKKQTWMTANAIRARRLASIKMDAGCILVVVDGRQPFYSAGATFDELADILLAHGAHFGMSLDGGGSSTMVIEGENGEPVILNSPIDQRIPGRERPVANHIGIFLNR